MIFEYTKEDPFGLVMEVGPKGAYEDHKIVLRRPVPDRVSILTKDCMGNLRDALDHAVWAAAVVMGPKPNPRKTAFPFGTNAAGVAERLRSSYLSDVPDRLKDLLASFNPHAEGDILLYGINELRNPNTHRRLISAVPNAAEWNINYHSERAYPGWGELDDVTFPRWDYEKDEMLIFRGLPSSGDAFSISFNYIISFPPPLYFAGRSIDEVLSISLSTVSHIVAAIESEARKYASGGVANRDS